MRHRLFDMGPPRRRQWSLKQMLGTLTSIFCAMIVFIMWFGMNSDHDNVHPIITQIMPAGHCNCQTSTTFQCADCLTCLASSPPPGPVEKDLDSLNQQQQQQAALSWRFEYGRDHRNLGLDRGQCQTAFPGLFQDVIRGADYWRSQGGITKEDLDAVSLQPGMARALIQDGELYVVAARARGEDHRRKILAALSSMHRALTAANFERSTISGSSKDTIEFIFSVEDRVDDVQGGGHPIWALARKASEQSVWLMPDFGFWSWEHWKQDIGPYGQAVDRVLDKEAHLGGGGSFHDKQRQLVWRGKLSFAPKLRRALLETARNQTWGDVKELDWSKKENAMSLEDHCRYMFIAHVEGRSYSASLKYRQACRSVIIAHKLQYIQHYHYLLVSSGPQQNYVEVERDFSDLPDKMHRLLDDPQTAEHIADNNVRTFRERYLTPAAEACYWRALWNGYAQVSNATDSLERMGKPAVERGLRYESFLLLDSREMMDFYHVYQNDKMKPFIAIPAIFLLVHRAWSRKSLTALGLVAAFLTAIAHAVHPWSAPFFLLVVFYLGGTKVTKVKHDVKARLTLSATGTVGSAEDQRTHIQVLANSIVATVLILLHARLLGSGSGSEGSFFSFGRETPAADVLVVGIVANYAAVAADTFSSELGILSQSNPRLITSLTLREVPPGTNGGVTATGLLAGVLGAFTVALTSAVLLPFRPDGGYHVTERVLWILAMTTWGALGSVLDSVLGGLLQASVVDKRSGKVIEGTGGKKVLIHPSSSHPGGTAETSSGLLSRGTDESLRLRQTETVANAAALKGSRATQSSVGTSPGRTGDTEHESRRVESGRDLLDNNAVNVLMALAMSLGAMGIARCAWV